MPDEIDAAMKEEQKALEEEAKRDITFDEYKVDAIPHILGQADNDRLAHESQEEEQEVPATGSGGKPGSRQTAARSKAGKS